MTEQKYTEKDLHKALFMNLVMMLASSAMQQMGKLVNPITNKTETNIEGAQVTIDMLAMLQQKTAKNLDTDEQRMIDQTLTSLQLTFVETSQTAGKTKPAQDTADKKTDAGSTPPSPAPEAGDKKDPKFRKSYGE